MIYTRIKDKRLYPNTVVFKGTDDNEITYINERVLEQIRAEIERLHHHPKLDFIKNDEVVEMALDIIDKHMKGESDAT